MPRTPDSFPGIRIDEGILLTDDDGYGLPGSIGEFRRSDGYFYMKDEYGVFNVRTYVHPHIYSHTAGGLDSFYVVSQTSPTQYEDINDGYDVGWRWINIADAYEYVCIDNTANAAVWVNTTGGSGSGISADNHRILRQLIHFIDDGPAEGFASGAYREITGTVFPTAIIWYTDSGKIDKIVERLVTWSGMKETTDKWKIYDTDGSTVLWTVSDAISYSGAFETYRTRTITEGDA